MNTAAASGPAGGDGAADGLAGPGRRGQGQAPAAAPTLAQIMALAGILLLALGLRLWGLEQNGWGAEYYTAAVRSMSINLHNFFYNAFDPAGFISLDKPPLALWPQVAGVKLLGFRPLAVLLPQVLEGVASVWVLHRLTRPLLGAGVALLAALFLAITPVWVAVNRTNNMDSCLVLVLLLAAWALLKAVKGGGRPWLWGSMALVGLAFNVKMLAAFVVLPAFFLVYALAAPPPWRRRLLDLCLAGLLVLALSLPWALAVELTPPERRPYVGSSTNNTMLELILGHNALGRFVALGRAPGAPVPGPAPRLAEDEGLSPQAGVGGDARSRVTRMAQRLFVRTPPGPLRLAQGQLAGQVAWLLPVALLAVALGARRGWLRRPLPPQGLALVFWLGWTATYAALYSYLGGIFHFYYLATLAPALAVLAALGLGELWNLWRAETWRAWLLPAALLLTAAWQLHVEAGALGWPWADLAGRPGEWLVWPHRGLVGASLAAVAGLAGAWLWRSRGRARVWLSGGAMALGLAGLLLLPLAWALSSVLLPGHGVLPSADAYRFTRAYPPAAIRSGLKERQAAHTAALIAFLQANHGGERYLLTTSTSQVAAPIIIRTGQPVLVRGGFHGLDPALDPAALERLVNQRQVRFAMLGDVAGVSRRMGAERAGRPLAEWIKAHGQALDPALWRGTSQAGGPALYDLRPEAGLLAAAVKKPAL